MVEPELPPGVTEEQARRIRQNLDEDGETETSETESIDRGRQADRLREGSTTVGDLPSEPAGGDDAGGDRAQDGDGSGSGGDTTPTETVDGSAGTGGQTPAEDTEDGDGGATQTLEVSEESGPGLESGSGDSEITEQARELENEFLQQTSGLDRDDVRVVREGDQLVTKFAPGAPEELATERLELQIEEQTGQDVEPGQDFTVQRTDEGGFEAVFSESFQRERATDQLETALETQYGVDVEPGEDFTVREAEGGGYTADLTQTGERRLGAAQRRQDPEALRAPSMEAQGFEFEQVTREQAATQFEEALEDQYGVDVEPGEHFTVEETDEGGFAPDFTTAGARRLGAARRRQDPDALTPPSMVEQGFEFDQRSAREIGAARRRENPELLTPPSQVEQGVVFRPPSVREIGAARRREDPDALTPPSQVEQQPSREVGAAIRREDPSALTPPGQITQLRRQEMRRLPGPDDPMNAQQAVRIDALGPRQRARAAENIERQLEQQTGADLEAGRDFSIVPGEEGFRASLTESGRERLQKEFPGENRINIPGAVPIVGGDTAEDVVGWWEEETNQFIDQVTEQGGDVLGTFSIYTGDVQRATQEAKQLQTVGEEEEFPDDPAGYFADREAAVVKAARGAKAFNPFSVALTVKEAGEATLAGQEAIRTDVERAFAGEESDEVKAFTEQTEVAGRQRVDQTIEAAQQDPTGFALQAAGGVLLTGGGLTALKGVSPRAASATSFAIQPFETVAVRGLRGANVNPGFKAANATAPARRAAGAVRSRTPQVKVTRDPGAGLVEVDPDLRDAAREATVGRARGLLDVDPSTLTSRVRRPSTNAIRSRLNTPRNIVEPLEQRFESGVSTARQGLTLAELKAGDVGVRAGERVGRAGRDLRAAELEDITGQLRRPFTAGRERVSEGVQTARQGLTLAELEAENVGFQTGRRVGAAEQELRSLAFEDIGTQIRRPFAAGRQRATSGVETARQGLTLAGLKAEDVGFRTGRRVGRAGRDLRGVTFEDIGQQAQRPFVAGRERATSGIQTARQGLTLAELQAEEWGVQAGRRARATAQELLDLEFDDLAQPARREATALRFGAAEQLSRARETAGGLRDLTIRVGDVEPRTIFDTEMDEPPIRSQSEDPLGIGDGDDVFEDMEIESETSEADAEVDTGREIASGEGTAALVRPATQETRLTQSDLPKAERRDRFTGPLAFEATAELPGVDPTGFTRSDEPAAGVAANSRLAGATEPELDETSATLFPDASAVEEAIGGPSLESETGAESRLGAAVDSRVQPRAESRVESRVAPRLESRVESRLEPRLESRLDTRQDTRVGLEAETRLEARQEARRETRLEVNPEPELRTEFFGDDEDDDRDRTPVPSAGRGGSGGGEIDLGTGWYNEFVQAFALGAGVREAPEQSELEGIEGVPALTEQRPTETALFGSEDEQAQIEAAADVFSFGGFGLTEDDS